MTVSRCATEADYARAVMVDGSRRCIQEVVAEGFTPVFLSTSCVFDGLTGGYRETDDPAPISNYGRLKVELERFLLETYPEGIVARLDKLVGVDPFESTLFSDWHRLAEGGQPIVCIENQVFGPTLVDDVVLTLRQACQHGLQGCYHLANPEPVRRDELAARFLDACGIETEIRSLPVENLNLAEARPLSSWLAADKICSELKVEFTPLSRILELYRAQMSDK